MGTSKTGVVREWSDARLGSRVLSILSLSTFRAIKWSTLGFRVLLDFFNPVMDRLGTGLLQLRLRPHLSNGGASRQ